MSTQYLYEIGALIWAAFPWDFKGKKGESQKWTRHHHITIFCWCRELKVSVPNQRSDPILQRLIVRSHRKFTTSVRSDNLSVNRTERWFGLSSHWTRHHHFINYDQRFKLNWQDPINHPNSLVQCMYYILFIFPYQNTCGIKLIFAIIKSLYSILC